MFAFRSMAPQTESRTLLVISVILIAVAAWVALWLLDDSAHGFFHHHGLHMHGGPSAVSALLFVGGWTVMTVAMMLPTSLPVITLFHTIAGRRKDRLLLVALVIAGYLIVWALFGVVVYSGNLLLQWLAGAVSWIGDQFWAGAPMLLILAGLFQFSPLKYRCLDKCRSPFSFVIGRWQGRSNRWNAFRLGVDHGVFCVGCCWALMLLMFAVGFGSLVWMMVLAAVMAIEKNVSWGRRMSAPLGIALLGWGTLLLAIA